MWLKKNTGFNYRSIAVFIFLFLNFSLAAPFINGASINATVVNSAGPVSQNHASDKEENNHPKHLLEDKQEYHSTRSKQMIAGVSYTASEQHFSFFRAIEASALKYANSSFLVRPAYYCLLFLYHLF